MPLASTEPSKPSPTITNLSNNESLIIVRKKREPETSIVFDTYWRFASERQKILFRRLRGENFPWTKDPILGQHKFTNPYRATDRVSQYLITNVISDGVYGLRDTVLRVLLFKFFNRIETWEMLETSLGEITEKTFDVRVLNTLLTRALNSGATIYSSAYIMPSGPPSIRKPRKHQMHLKLLDSLMRSKFPEKLSSLATMREMYNALLDVPSIGPFLAYQFSTDLNYSEHFDYSEMEFVVAGPGARDGMRKCFKHAGEYQESDLIRWITDRQEYEFSTRGLEFKKLGTRPLQLIDCQNLFCEVDKYSRAAHPEVLGISGRKRIKQKFTPKSSLSELKFPPKWKVDLEF